MKLHAVTLAIILVCAVGPVVHAQTRTGVGLIAAVDAANDALVLETRNGPRHVRVAPGAIIRGDDGAVLTLRDLGPGDTVSYQISPEGAIRLHVARHFWALPSEP